MRFRIPFATTITPVAGGPSYSPGDEAALAAVLDDGDVDGYLASGVLVPAASEPAPITPAPITSSIAADGYSVRDVPPPLTTD